MYVQYILPLYIRYVQVRTVTHPSLVVIRFGCFRVSQFFTTNLHIINVKSHDRIKIIYPTINLKNSGSKKKKKI